MVRQDKETLKRAKKVLNVRKDKDFVEYEEYLYLYKKYKKALNQAYNIFEISDTYQDKLIKTKETLKNKIEEKNKIEKKLNQKIEELKNTQENLKNKNKELEELSTRDQLTGLYNR